uniref:CSD domain-containing protein n=1 Tax=Globodera rostochiensis TaxID=31243 RepID=A0A914HK37_GLORO
MATDQQLQTVENDAKPDADFPVVLKRGVQGRVKWYSAENAYGFIQRYDTNEDIFVHGSFIVRFSVYTRGRHPVLSNQQEVEFDVVRVRRGLEAHCVSGPGGRLVGRFIVPRHAVTDGQNLNTKPDGVRSSIGGGVRPIRQRSDGEEKRRKESNKMAAVEGNDDTKTAASRHPTDGKPKPTDGKPKPNNKRFHNAYRRRQLKFVGKSKSDEMTKSAEEDSKEENIEKVAKEVNNEKRAKEDEKGAKEDNIEKGAKEDNIEKGAKEDNIEKGAKEDSIEKGAKEDNIEKVAKEDSIEKGAKEDSIEKGAKEDSIEKGAKEDDDGGNQQKKKKAEEGKEAASGQQREDCGGVKGSSPDSGEEEDSGTATPTEEEGKGLKEDDDVDKKAVEEEEKQQQAGDEAKADEQNIAEGAKNEEEAQKEH